MIMFKFNLTHSHITIVNSLSLMLLLSDNLSNITQGIQQVKFLIAALENLYICLTNDFTDPSLAQIWLRTSNVVVK